MRTDPARVYRLYEEGATAPVTGQLEIVDAIPGEAGYSDFRQVVRVTVPAGYVANTHASLDDLRQRELPDGHGRLDRGRRDPARRQRRQVNCPIVAME